MLPPEHKSDPRHRVRGAGANVTKGAGRTGQSNRFRDVYALTATELETAIATADCVQLARAADPYGFVVPDHEVRFRCPTCDRKQAHAESRWRWRCEACDQHGSWLALRQLVAVDVEACCRLAEIVHGIEVGRPVRDAA